MSDIKPSNFYAPTVECPEHGDACQGETCCCRDKHPQPSSVSPPAQDVKRVFPLVTEEGDYVLFSDYTAKCDELERANARLNWLGDELREIDVDEHISKSGGSETLALVNHRADVAEAELERVQQWKREQLAVESTWDAQAVGKELGVTFGASIRPEILPKIKALKSELERVRQERDEANLSLRLVRGNCAKEYKRAEAAESHVVALREALEKIDAIRNDIVGRQSIGFSRHVYPLVAALNAAGFPGKSYEECKAGVEGGTE